MAVKKLKANQSRPAYLTVLILLGILNLFIVDGWILIKVISSGTDVLGESVSACPQACINYINQSSTGGTSAREYFIPLGTGINQTDEWQDVDGAQAYVDSTQYRKLKKVTFEATLEIPAGAQISYVRLFNATDKHPVWYSEISTGGSNPQLLVSSPITLEMKKRFLLILETDRGRFCKSCAAR